MLTLAGYAVEALASAGDFLTREPFLRPCCVVLDVRLPGLSGLGLQETLAQAGRRMPIVFITGHGDISMSVSAEDSALKPVTVVGVALIILGVLALAYQVTYTTREKVIDLGPFKASVDKEKTIPLPPIVGGLALVGGVVLVIVGARKS